MNINKKRLAGLLFSGLLFAAHPLWATVETKTVNAFQAGEGVADTTLSGDGKFFFVLMTNGTVNIYATDGASKDTFSLEGTADRIASSQTGDLLYLTDSSTGSTKMVEVSFVQDITVEGSPFKGPEKAPVVVAIFSDFQ